MKNLFYERMPEMLSWEPHYCNRGMCRFFQWLTPVKKLLDRERYSVMDRECLGIVWGIKKFAMYTFTLQTDHRPLQFLSALKFENPRIMWCALVLQNYNFKVEHIKGKDTVGADFLSRAVE